VQGGIEIELLSYDATIFDGQGGQQLEAVEQPFGFEAAVWLDITDDYAAGRVCGTQGGVPLRASRMFWPTPAGRAEEDAQPPALARASSACT